MTVPSVHPSEPEDSEHPADADPLPGEHGDRTARARARGVGAARRAAVATLPAYVASRLVVFVVAKATTWLFPQLTVTQALSGWDGGWYLAIAANGYPDAITVEGGAGVRWAFFPALPAAIRGISELTGLSLPVSGILLSLVAGAIAIGAIWLLVEDVLGAETATATATLMCFFPSAFVLSMVYTESLFLMVSALGLYAMTRRRWITAGAMTSAACLLRAPGLVLVVVLAVVVLRETLSRRATLRMYVGLALSAAGFAAWTTYQWIRLGDPTAYLDAQRLGWYNEFNWFTTPFRSLWRVATDRADLAEGTEVMGALGLLVVVLGVALAVPFIRRNRRRVPLEWWVYTAGSLAFAFTPYWPTSILRYTYALFPLFAVALAQLPRRLVTPLLCVAASMMAVLCAVAIGGIVNWQNAPFAP